MTRHMLVCCAVAFAVALVSTSASARVAEVFWSPGDEGAELRTRDQAREAAFRAAVFAEALDILPGSLSLPRQDLLRQFLLPKAGDYVLSYIEAAADAAPQAAAPLAAAPAAPAGSHLMRLDVTVNRSALKKTLQRMGVYYTVRALRTYDLALTGDAGGALGEIGRLQDLSGLSVRRGAQPLMEISANWDQAGQGDAKAKAKGAPSVSWSGRLEMDGESWTAAGADLAGVWFELLGHFFSRPGAEAGVVEQVPLAVKGWYAPDGVHAFDVELASWDGLVESRVLERVAMLPDGIGAVWTLRTLNREDLARKLGEALSGRGLTWEFAEQLPNP